MEVQETPPTEEQFENVGEEQPQTEEPQVTEEATSEDEIIPETSETEEVIETPSYYTPEEMRLLQVDGIDTSRIPPEMQPLYQAMQAPITRKSQELSERMKNMEQGQEPLQDNQPAQQQTQPQQPSIDEVAVNMTIQKLGLAEKPDAWDNNYESYMLELADTRRDLKDSVTRQNQAMNELNTFKSGFTPEQFTQIDSQAETKMYSLLADPSTRADGQRIQHAMNSGDTDTILSFMRDVAKEVLSAPTQQTQRTAPPMTTTPSGATASVAKDPSNMNADEYRAYRMGTA